jgi:ferredoxin-NADP reductase
MTAVATASGTSEIDRSVVQVPETDNHNDRILKCVQVQQVTHDVRTFVFEAVEPGLGQHQPGQYLVLGVEIDGEIVERCYTISSPPTRPARVAITVKREPGGLVSNWLHDHLDAGGRLFARGPYGRFSVVHHPADRYVLLSGGSGATPMMATLRTFFDLGRPVDVAYLHSARSPADILFRHELDWMNASTATHPTMAVTYVCERSSQAETSFGESGRIDIAMVSRAVPDIAQREVFACGPPRYLEAARQIVAALGVPTERYHEESFIAAWPAGEPAEERSRLATALAPTPDSTLANAPGSGSASLMERVETFSVKFARSEQQIECAPGTTLMTAAARAGVRLPSSCGQGMCGTCKLTMLSGKVEMNHQGGIRPKEIAAGKILPCCSVPTTAVVLDA